MRVVLRRGLTLLGSLLFIVCQCSHQKNLESRAPNTQTQISDQANNSSQDKTKKVIRVGKDATFEEVDNEKVVQGISGNDSDVCIVGKTEGCVLEVSGWLTTGLSDGDVLDNLGDPDEKGEFVYNQHWSQYEQDWLYKSKGIRLTMIKESDSSSAIVESIIISRPCMFETNEGVGVGTPAKVVEEKYSGRRNTDYSNEKRLVIGDLNWGTVFVYEDGKVKLIMIGDNM